jgi:hypothetical protein
MAKYQVWYKKSPNFLAAPKLVDLSEYTKVATVEATSTGEVFRMMNAVDGSELCCKLGVRSMSVGDLLVEVSSDGFQFGRTVACDPLGWREVDAV